MRADNRNHAIARTLTLIPIVVFIITAVCLVLAAILEFPTDRGAIYAAFASIGVLSLFFSPLPCFVMAVVGTVFAAKAMNERIAQSRTQFVIGIVEIIANLAWTILAAIMFYAGLSV